MKAETIIKSNQSQTYQRALQMFRNRFREYKIQSIQRMYINPAGEVVAVYWYDRNGLAVCCEHPQKVIIHTIIEFIQVKPINKTS